MMTTALLAMAIAFDPASGLSNPQVARVQDARDAVQPGMSLKEVERLLPKQSTESKIACVRRAGGGGHFLVTKQQTFVASRLTVLLDNQERVVSVLKD